MNKINIIIIFFLSLTCMYCPTMAQFDSRSLYMAQKTEQMAQLFFGRHWDRYLTDNKIKEPDWFKKCNADVFSVLDKLYLKDNQELHIELLTERGSRSFIYIQEGVHLDEDSFMRNVYLKELTLQSCWQWVLLYHVLQFFPYGVFYHDRFYFVNTDKEWASVVSHCKDDVIPDSVWAFEEYECNQIPESQYEAMKAFKIQPSPIILIDREQNLVHIRFYGWSRWSGLTEKHIYLKTVENKQLEVLKYDNNVIFEHHEGTFF